VPREDVAGRTLPLNRRLRVGFQRKSVAVTGSMMVRDALIGIGRHLVTVALGMRLPAAG